jgi:hypothetical protein
MTMVSFLLMDILTTTRRMETMIAVHDVDTADADRKSDYV